MQSEYQTTGSICHLAVEKNNESKMYEHKMNEEVLEMVKENWMWIKTANEKQKNWEGTFWAVA